VKMATTEKDGQMVARVGIEGLITSLERTSMEWQYPLPWSVSRALGAACKKVW